MRREMKSVEVATLLSVLQFTAKILLPRHHNSLFPIFSSLYIAYRNQKMRNMSVTVSALPDDVLLELLPDSVRDAIEDTLNLLCVSNGVLDELCLSNGRWVKVGNMNPNFGVENNPDNFESQTQIKFVLMQIVGLPDLDVAKALISDIKFDNLKNDLELCENSKISINSRGFPRDFKPSKAAKANVKMVKRPPDIENMYLDTLLTNYFKYPRYLSVGDLFCVNVAQCAPEIRYLLGSHSVEKLYFVVDEIIGPPYNDSFFTDLKVGYFVEHGISTLLQSGYHQRFIPCSMSVLAPMRKRLTVSNFMKNLLSKCPQGLEKYFHQLEESLKPFLFIQRSISVKPFFLIYGPRGSGKKDIILSVAQKLGLSIWNLDCLEIQSNAAASTEGKLRFAFTKVRQYVPCIMLMNGIEHLCKTKNEEDDARTISVLLEQIEKLFSDIGKLPVILIAVCHSRSESVTNISPSLARAFLDTIRVCAPTESERLSMLEWLVRSRSLLLDPAVSLAYYASQTSGFVLGDLEALISHAVRNNYKQLKNSLQSDATESLDGSGYLLKEEDFEVALEIMHSTYADVIGAPKIPAVLWEDIGGLSKLKEEIHRTVMMPLKHPELVASGLRRSGLLLFGPPGTGKTLLAKAIATECSLNFLSIKGPELLNMYVGQSEQNVREVFERARSASPCIIFFDELDSLAPSRGRSGDSGGVMDRVVSQLLAEMDGIQKSTHMFLIGATNRPDLIDPALLRPGRFDKLLYVGMCEDNETKLSVLKALTRKFKLKPDVKLMDVVEQFPDIVTGADVYSVCSKAWLNAVRSIVNKIENGAPEDRSVALSTVVEVSSEDFGKAVADMTPSVSDEDMAYYHKVRKELGGV